MFVTIRLLFEELCLKNYFVLVGDTCRFSSLFVWLTISNCLKMWRYDGYDGYDGYEECKNVYRKQIKKTSIFICLTFLCHKLANYKDALRRNFSKIDSPKIGSWNKSLSVFKLRYLEEYVMDWNRWKSKFVHTLLESKIFWQ